MIWRGGDWSVVRCCGCGLSATWPRPESHLLDAIYDEPAYYERRSDPHQGAWLLRAESIVTALPAAPSSVLDFGTGEGHLVAAFRHLAIHADGVEPSPAARAVALSTHGIALAPSLPRETHRRYDTAVLLHSLEHVPDPVKTMRHIAGLLVPGGAVYVEVPHAGSIDLLLLPKWRRAILDLPVHLHHFTPRTLGRVMEAAGFSCARLQLFNATPVESALARRSPRRIDYLDRQKVTASAMSPNAASRLTTTARLLAATRHVFAGPKFRWIGTVS